MSTLNWSMKACGVFLLRAMAAVALPAQTFTSLYSFDGTDGSLPLATLLQGSDGNFYGTTSSGGNSAECLNDECGTIFQITPGGTLTTIHNLTGADGANPFAGLIEGADKNFYGTTENGGANGFGTAFKITSTSPYTLTTLYSFCSQPNCTDGYNPVAGLIQGSDGNFYGTALYGGAGADGGVVFQLTPTGSFTVLYSLCSLSNCADGESPAAGLVQDADGNFYGTTEKGGANGFGTGFTITSTSPYTLTTLYSFCSQGGSSCTDGSLPVAALYQAANGIFYGTTSQGGTSSNCTGGCGTLFQITSSGALTTLHSFEKTDGSEPEGSLLAGADGNFYGTTGDGGANNLGTVFTITPAGMLTTLHSFIETDGEFPVAGLIQATNGYFYATTLKGGTGTDGTGTIFSISGTIPTATTLAATSITLTGAELNGTINPQSGSGNAVFSFGTNPAALISQCVQYDQCPAVTPNSSPQPFSFALTGLLGNTTYYFQIVFWDSDNNILYSGAVRSFITQNPAATTTAATSITASGTVLNGTINPEAGTGYAGFYWGTDPTLTTYTLSCTTWTSCPPVTPNTKAQKFSFALTGLASNTAYYFETVYWDTSSNTYYYGSIDSLTTKNPAATTTPATSITATTAVLNGTINPEGAAGYAGFYWGTDPTLSTYTLSCTSWTSCPPVAPNSNTQRFSFMLPDLIGLTNYYFEMVFWDAGNNSYSYGSITSFETPSPLTTLHSFDDTDGDEPLAGLVQATKGFLYGTTLRGGASGDGTAFKITSSGTLTSLVSFDLTDGNLPWAAPLQVANGSFYGTTGGGGALDEGSVFKLTPGGALTTVYNFCSLGGTCPDGEAPEAGLVQDAQGNFYGTTAGGGSSSGYGTVFKLTPSDVLTTLHTFEKTDGDGPTAPLLLGSDGNFYGTTSGGGTYFQGTVFQITPSGTLTTLHNFDFADGAAPYGGLVQASNGNFYGTTYSGEPGNGTIYEITSGGTLTTLYRFCLQTGCPDGAAPYASLAQGTDGNLYGATSEGGGADGVYGTLFKITTGGTLTTLYTFCRQSNCTDGYGPQSPLIQDTNGNFYGTTVHGGTSTACLDGCGTVFSFTAGLAPFVETVPTSGNVGAAVTILGTSLTGATSVTFNDTAATFTVVSGSEISTTVPTGATTGTVQVVTPSGGTLSSNVPFTVN
jgi:uncharacterized repeat protein (TIGR03803 family)